MADAVCRPVGVAGWSSLAVSINYMPEPRVTLRCLTANLRLRAPTLLGKELRFYGFQRLDCLVEQG